MRLRSDYVPVVDPFGVTRDPAMPFLADALDPLAIEREFAAHIDGPVLQSIRVTRHKPGRRCLIEYQFKVDSRLDRSPTTALRAGSAEWRDLGPIQRSAEKRSLHFGRDDHSSETRSMRSNTITLLGKARAKSLDLTGYQTTQAVWDAGFNSGSSDGIMVPEPVGTVPAFQMWLQRKVSGVVAAKLLPTPGGTDLARRIAGTALKLHRSGVPSNRRHTPADEMQILHERLTALAGKRPELSSRIKWVLDACAELATGLPQDSEQGIHRDFYPDQVLVDGPRLYLLDLDLYTTGDPALDIGNFRGHLIEQSLRSFGRPDALWGCELALSDQYNALAETSLDNRVTAYTTLTLARHIAISTLFPERRHLTETLVSMCEDRLGIGSCVEAQ